jgi:hypothetical protein
MKLLDDPIELERPVIDIGPNGTSLDLLQAIYRDTSFPVSIRKSAAIACLPFEHPRLAVTAVLSDQSLAARLERAVERSDRVRSQMKVIEVKATASEGLSKRPSTDLTLAPAIPDRRFRRRA